MEHRYFSRVPIDVKMLIYRGGLPVATGRIRNASRVGLFVETDYGELRQHQKLECEFCLGDEGRHRLGAHVSRRADAGVGLELDEDGAAGGAIYSLLTRGAELRTQPLEQEAMFAA